MLPNMARKGAGARVRGECKDGHVTETTAAPNRVTWTGTCSQEGCELPVTCHRIKSTETKKNDAGGDKSKARVRRVKGYVRPSDGARVGSSERRGDAGAGDDGTPAAPREGGEPEPGFDEGKRPDIVDESDDWGIFPGFSR